MGLKVSEEAISLEAKELLSAAAAAGQFL